MAVWRTWPAWQRRGLFVLDSTRVTGGLHQAHLRRQAYLDTLVSSPHDISRMPAFENMSQLDSVRGIMNVIVEKAKHLRPIFSIIENDEKSVDTNLKTR
jgi:hypothetical protein